jgi:uncharacterized protein
MMPEDLMRYDQLTQNALRGIVREALRIVAKSGLPGDHHFYIAFDTRHPGVRISEKHLQRYPREMTIVIQHQYSNLIIDEDKFEIDLVFDQVPERLVIPFAALKGFLDPAVQFGLQFVVVPVEAKAQDAIADAKVDSESETSSESAVAAEPANGPKVVSLDAFRKK